MDRIVWPAPHPMTRLVRLGADFLLRTDLCSLRRVTGEPIHLRPQTFQTLLFLLEHRDRLVTKEELTSAIWGDLAVTDDALVQCIVEARRALEDDARRPRYIRTLPKVGYQFVGDVEELAEARVAEETAAPVEPGDAPAPLALPSPPVEPPAARSQPGRRLALWTAAAVGIAAAALLVSRWLASSTVELTAEPKRVAVAVMYLENQSGGEDLAWMRKGLADMLITGLSRSSRLSVISREQLDTWLTRTGHDGTAEISLTDAIEVARRSQADYFVLGGYVRLGVRFRIDVRLYDGSGRLRAAEQLNVADPGQVLIDVDSLSWRLARHLGEAVRSPVDQLAAGLTTNLDAFRFYSLGVERALGYEISEAIRLFERALELDPQFVMARARIGFAHLTNSEPAQARPYLDEAFRGIDRVTEKDRLHLDAWRATANWEYDAAIAAYRRAIDRYPGDVEAYARLGNVLIGEKRYDEAIDILQRGLRIDAESGDLHNFLARAYTPLARHQDAIRERQIYVELAPKEPLAHDTLGLSYQWAGRYEDAIAAYQRALDLRPDFEPAVFHLANAYFQTGRYRTAMERYQRYAKIAQASWAASRSHNAQALVHLARGETALAGQLAAASLVGFPDNDFTIAHVTIHARPGAALDALARRVPKGNPYQNRGRRQSERMAHFARGRIALARGESDTALDYLRRALREEPPIWDPIVLEDCLANAYLELSRFDDAIVEYQRVLHINPRYPLAHYRLATAYERTGRHALARAGYEEFLRVWHQADTDVPEIVIAKQRLAVLSTAADSR
jgi:tetratricopeptide (TPR) repeat protein/DNA-binding winged helix-turn-helix (wHTH) protein/TolB-like protein